MVRSGQILGGLAGRNKLKENWELSFGCVRLEMLIRVSSREETRKLDLKRCVRKMTVWRHRCERCRLGCDI